MDFQQEGLSILNPVLFFEGRKYSTAYSFWALKEIGEYLRLGLSYLHMNVLCIQIIKFIAFSSMASLLLLLIFFKGHIGCHGILVLRTLNQSIFLFVQQANKYNVFVCVTNHLHLALMANLIYSCTCVYLSQISTKYGIILF